MKEYLSLINIQTLGSRCDVTPLFADPDAFAQLVTDLSLPFQSDTIDYIAGIDALGFILGTAIAVKLHKGFIPIRKGGKLPVEKHTRTFIDYTGMKKALELRKGSYPESAKLLLVDEWIETGAQIRTAIELIEEAKGIVVGVTAINMDLNPNTLKLSENYKIHTVWRGSRTE